MPAIFAACACISIHAPTRGATYEDGARYILSRFQSTLPREERPFPTDFVTAFMPYFNPRSHERSDFTGDYTFEVTLISIHAPTRGATGIVFLVLLSLMNFNPRSHERSDGSITSATEGAFPISIHAPTRGATKRRKYNVRS